MIQFDMKQLMELKLVEEVFTEVTDVYRTGSLVAPTTVAPWWPLK